MANEKITLRAKANKLGIAEYRAMSTDELRDAIKRAETGTSGKGKPAPAKGKSTSNGKAAPAKGKATPAKGKSAPAKGKASSKSQPAKKSTRKAASVKKTATKAAKGTAKRATTARGKGKAVANGLRRNLGKINWNRQSNVGTTGKRKDVLDALREHKGDKAAAFKKLKRKAQRFYPGKDAHEAERMLVWLIGRVAYDYAYKTGQHEPGDRAEYGTSDKPQDIARREARAAAHRPKRSRKATPAKGKAARGKTAAKGRKTTTAKRGRR